MKTTRHLLAILLCFSLIAGNLQGIRAAADGFAPKVASTGFFDVQVLNPAENAADEAAGHSGESQKDRDTKTGASSAGHTAEEAASDRAAQNPDKVPAAGTADAALQTAGDPNAAAEGDGTLSADQTAADADGTGSSADAGKTDADGTGSSADAGKADADGTGTSADAGKNPAEDAGSADAADKTADGAADESADKAATESDDAQADETASGESKNADKKAAGSVPDDTETAETFDAGTLALKGAGYQITLSYGADARIPADAQLSAKEIKSRSPEYAAYVEEAAATIAKEEQIEADSLPYARFFDITITDKDGEKIEPAAAVDVKIDLKEKVLKTEDVTFSAVHFEEEESGSGNISGTELIELDTKTGTADAGTVAGFSAEGFSVYGVVYYYTVDFYYTPEGQEAANAYHLNGGSSMRMSELFEKLGIQKKTADITKVEFTDDSLVTFKKEGGDYIVTSVKPFTTSETLTIRFADGSILAIGVEDAIGEGPIGNCSWTVSDDGTLTISGNGTLPTIDGSKISNPVKEQQLKENYGWQDPSLRYSIKRVVITEGVVADKELRGAFHGLENLEEADLSGLDAMQLRGVHDLFSGCGKLKKVTFGSNFAPRQGWRMFSGCTSLTEITFGSEEKPYDISQNYFPFQMFNSESSSQNKNNKDAFKDCGELTTLNIYGGKFYDGQDVSYLTTAFGAANGKGKTFNIIRAEIHGSWGGSTTAPARTMFKVDTLETLNLKNSKVYELRLRTMFHNFNTDFTIKDYNACKGLTAVDLTGTSFVSPDGDYVTAQQMFQGNGSTEAGIGKLKTVILTGVNFNNTENFNQMFRNTPSLELVRIDRNAKLDRAVRMAAMFENSAAKEVDLSGIGQLPNIISVQDMFRNCKVKTLNLSNFDNSVIRPANTFHKAKDEPGPVGEASQRNANVDWARNMALDTCTDLMTLNAQNSKIWMVYNDSGNPGKEYYNASDDTNPVCFFTKKTMTFHADAGPADVQIDSDRDYIDLIIDRDGSANVHTTNPHQDPLPDAGSNINIKDGDLNGNGPGFLAPGVYTLLDAERSDPAHAPMEDTYYRIAYVGEKPYTVEWPAEGIPGLVKVEDSASHNYVTINTEMKDWNTDGSETIDCGSGIKIVYKDVAIDCNGKLHNVVVTIHKITFKDLQKVPYLSTYVSGVAYGNRVHDTNVLGDKVLDDHQQYYRPVLQATKDGITLLNYIRAGGSADPNLPGSGTQMLTGGSGTDIEFTIAIEDANADTSFVFLAKDLDVAASQNWQYDPDGDACKDVLNVRDVSYGAGGEGFILGPGVKTNTVQFASETGLYKAVVDGKTNVLTTGGDPNTPWSEFTVTGDAQGSTFTWTSGVGCTTYILENTKEQDVGEISLQPQVKKQLINGTLAADAFEFTLSKAETDPVSPEGAPEPVNAALPQTKKNDANGNVTFDVLTFKSDINNPNQLIAGAGTFPYYPGTGLDPENTQGQGEHNTFTYTYTIREKKGTTEGIFYDDAEHVLKIKISAPQNDSEMKKGIKAEIFVDDIPAKTYWHSASYTSIATGTLTDKWYDENGTEVTDPNPINLNGITFNNSKIAPLEVKIPVEKVLTGRSWKNTDAFGAALIITSDDANTPMPSTVQSVDDLHWAETKITSADTPITDGTGKVIGYKDVFDAITYTLADVGKTYTYTVRELTPTEDALASVPGVTYDETSRYKIEVTIEVDRSDASNPKLKADIAVKDKDSNVLSTDPRFTNTYDANETIYKMEAVKNYHDVNNNAGKTLTGGEFTFGIKPIGDNAAKAPMPKDATGTGADRIFTAQNEADGDIEFENTDDPEDGLVFNYQALLAAGISDEALHSAEGVDFEYEMWELIPGTDGGRALAEGETVVNNNDGTWTVTDCNGTEIIYDGIHHTRKITVKVRTQTRTNDNGTPDDSSDDTTEQFDELYIEGHQDDHAADFYIDKNGEKKEANAQNIPGYNPETRHFKVNAVDDLGAPIFINHYFDPAYGNLTIKKSWDDADDQDGIRPASVVMNLKNTAGTDPVRVELRGRDWKTTVSDLPVYTLNRSATPFTAEKVTYTLEEQLPAGYEAAYDPSPASFEFEQAQDYMMQINVTNTHTPGKGAVEGDETYGGRGMNQTGTPDYQVNPKNPVTPERLVKPDVEGAEISDDGKTVTLPEVGTYTLNDDGTILFSPEYDFVGDPTPVQVEGKDRQGNVIRGTYTPHVIDNIEEVTKIRRITYVYEDGSPVKDAEGNPLTDEFEMGFSRDGEVDPETGEIISWNPWYPVDIPEVTSPKVPGYTPDKAAVAAVEGATPDTWPKDEVVTYRKNEEPAKDEPSKEEPQKDDKTPGSDVPKDGKTQPQVTPQPVQPTPVNKAPAAYAPKTGDESRPLVWGGLLVLALALMIVLWRFLKPKK